MSVGSSLIDAVYSLLHSTLQHRLWGLPQFEELWYTCSCGSWHHHEDTDVQHGLWSRYGQHFTGSIPHASSFVRPDASLHMKSESV